MDFKKILLKNTNLPDDIINQIIKYKRELECPIEINLYFNENLIGFRKPLYLEDKITLHDFIYFLKYYYNDYKYLLDKCKFNLNLIYLDESDFYRYVERDHDLCRTFSYKQLLYLLNFEYKYVYLTRMSIVNDPMAFYGCYYTMNIKLCDPGYENVYRKKHKNRKKIQKFLWYLKKKVSFL